ncbi:MAG TPA: YlxR family protein [Anaerolineae bacterium]|nr:YlxR family protein [Anaerolineae bacterium]
MPGKHIPQRTCVGCGEVQGKRQLMRVVRTPDGRVHVDPTGKANGRGAYVHERRACWEKALHGRLGHALKIERLNDDDLAALERHAATLSDDPLPPPVRTGGAGGGREAVT